MMIITVMIMIKTTATVMMMKIMKVTEEIKSSSVDNSDNDS